MAAQKKVIITCAVTGAIHTPSMSPHLPVTAQEIADAAVGAAEAGAAIIHLHARDPVDGQPDQRPEAFVPFLRDIKARCDAVINLTTGGSPYMTVQERMQPAQVLKPEVASMNMGSMNFGLFPMLQRFKEFKHDWERPYLEGSKDLIFRNTFGDIETVLTRTVGEPARATSSSATTPRTSTTWRTSSTAGWCRRRSSCRPCSASSAASAAHPDDVMHMKRTADRLFGSDYRWSVLGAGRSQMPIAAMAAAMGGNVRVGLEDSLWIGPGRLAESNAQQVRKAREIIEGLGLAGGHAGRGAPDPGAEGQERGGVLRSRMMPGAVLLVRMYASIQ